MEFAVCVKQVPDTTEVTIDPRTPTLVRERVPAIVYPDDLHALEEALRWRDRLGGRVTVLTMGPPQAEAALRRALSLGADRAVLLTDRAFAGADTYATTLVLARALRRLERKQGAPFDLVWCGRQALDGDTGQVGPGRAARLGVPLLAYRQTRLIPGAAADPRQAAAQLADLLLAAGVLDGGGERGG